VIFDIASNKFIAVEDVLRQNEQHACPGEHARALFMDASRLNVFWLRQVSYLPSAPLIRQKSAERSLEVIVIPFSRTIVSVPIVYEIRLAGMFEIKSE